MASSITMPDALSDTVGRQYKIGSKLGKGGFAVCYRTEVSGQHLALKVSRTIEMNEKLRDKMITELQIHSKVRHANIIQFHRAFSVQDNTYIALELCTNGTLKEMLSNRGRISMPETRRFGMQLCGALHYLHSRRVIHRDIKTANILLDDQMNIKLADFGLAAVLVTDEEMGEVKRRVTVCGTPNYIAPEILHKKKGHDTKADIWSLGVLFYNMLTGMMPFSKPDDKGHDAVFKRVAEGAFSWPEHASKTLSAVALDLVNCMLQRIDVERPEAIEVAHHDFFKLGAIPFKLEPSFVATRPVWLKKADPQDMRLNARTISHESMLVACGLDDGSITRPPLAELSQENEPTRTMTKDVTHHKIPLSHLLLHEFNQGLVPTLPLRGVYEPSEYPTQGSLKIKPRKAKLPERSTSQRKDLTISSTSGSTPEPESKHQFISPEQGLNVMFADLDMNVIAHNVWDIIKGRTLTKKRTARGLPPVVLHSLETEKWGVGYVLADGSIGLLSKRRAPEKAIVISNAIQHFKSVADPKDAKPLPDNSVIYCLERGVSSTASPASTGPPNVKVYLESGTMYSSALTTSAGSSGRYKLEWATSDPFHSERGKALSLWSRYATYLAAKVQLDDLDMQATPAAPNVYLSVWQTIGNVQVWHWKANTTSPDNGGWEFEFKDRTRLALSTDCVEARFTYDADAGLTTPVVTSPPVRRLETLELPLSQLVSASATKNPLIWRVLEVNHFRQKLEFARDVLILWMSHGIGKFGSQKMAYRGPLVGVQNQDDDVEMLRYYELIL